jgi:hypothetical protein
LCNSPRHTPLATTMADSKPEAETAKTARPGVFEVETFDFETAEVIIEKAAKNEDDVDDYEEVDTFGVEPMRVTIAKAAKKKNAIAAAIETPTEAATAAINRGAEYKPFRSSKRLAHLAPPPDAQRGSKWAPWNRLTEWEMAVLRKKMIKNGTWKPSFTMGTRELERKHRSDEDYAMEKARCEAAGEEILDEEPKSLQDLRNAYALGLT